MPNITKVEIEDIVIEEAMKDKKYKRHTSPGLSPEALSALHKKIPNSDQQGQSRFKSPRSIKSTTPVTYKSVEDIDFETKTENDLRRGYSALNGELLRKKPEKGKRGAEGTEKQSFTLSDRKTQMPSFRADSGKGSVHVNDRDSEIYQDTALNGHF